MPTLSVILLLVSLSIFVLSPGIVAEVECKPNSERTWRGYTTQDDDFDNKGIAGFSASVFCGPRSATDHCIFKSGDSTRIIYPDSKNGPGPCAYSKTVAKYKCVCVQDGLILKPRAVVTTAGSD